MATKILMKKSVTGGSSPLTGDLDQGELAINLVDRKIYTKNSANVITEISSAYVDASAPSNPVEGDLWYDTANNLLKAHNGTGFVATGLTDHTALSNIGTLTHAQLEAAQALNNAKVTNVSTNLGYATAATTGTVTSSDGTNATLPAATTSLAGLLTGADKTLLNSALQSETDTLATVTGRGATTATAVSITNGTASSNTTTGALKVTGGVGIGGNLNVGGNTILTGNLTVNGTTPTVNTNTVTIGDNIIKLNADETGTPSQNAGFEIERGTGANVSFLFDESTNSWDLNSLPLQNVTIDGGTY